MAHVAVCVDWYGPYRSIPDAKKAADEMGEGLYVGIGKTKHGRKIKIHYVGVSGNLGGRLNNSHHKLSHITREVAIWVGEVSSAGKPGPKSRSFATTIDLAEASIAYFLQPSLNKMKTANPPRGAITLLSRWWKKDGETPFNRRPHPDWPDLIDYRGSPHATRIGWLGVRGRLRRIESY